MGRKGPLRCAVLPGASACEVPRSSQHGEPETTARSQGCSRHRHPHPSHAPACRVMTRPSPVPPNLRVVDAFAWRKAWKSCGSTSGAMPIPVSRPRTEPALLPPVTPAASRARDGAPLGEFHCIAHQIQQRLAQARQVTDATSVARDRNRPAATVPLLPRFRRSAWSHSRSRLPA